MRLLALVGLLGLLSGCGVGAEEAAGPDSERTEMGPSESWCRSYTTQQHCPKYICHWDGTACTLPPASGTGTPEQAGTAPAAEEVTQQGPSERWCNSYTTQQYCPSVCAWYSYPAPGYCGLKATSVTEPAPEQSNDCPGPAECTTNRDCDSKCGGPGTGSCSVWTCLCSA